MSSVYNAKYCSLHGAYYGFSCPSCGSSSVPSAPLPQAARSMDPTPTLMRIAAALERIATALEAHVTFEAEDTP